MVRFGPCILWSFDGPFLCISLYFMISRELASRSIAAYSESSKIIIEKSTVPVRTADSLYRVLRANPKYEHIEFAVLSNPEFLSEGETGAGRELDGCYWQTVNWWISTIYSYSESSLSSIIGTAIRDLENPDRVLVGGEEKTATGQFAISVIHDFVKSGSFRVPLLCVPSSACRSVLLTFISAGFRNLRSLQSTSGLLNYQNWVLNIIINYW